jgi:two-component system chemotaxis response regulator CheB
MGATVRKTRVLIVDDSAIVRRMLSNALQHEPDIEVVGLASDPFVARDLIVAHKPDILTLDIEMPKMDGLTFLRQLMVHRPMPVIIVSSVTQTGSAASFEALNAGAVDVIAKPGGPYSVGDIAEKLKYRIRAVRMGRAVRYARMRAQPSPLPEPAVSLKHANGLILVGASTGGTRAIEMLLTRMPSDAPPILIVQHMPAHFTKVFAERLDSVCPMKVLEAGDAQPLKRGVAYIAPGDFHLEIAAHGFELKTALNSGPAIHYQRPAVDALFKSASRLMGVPIVSLLLTGMGSDGADGMVALKEAGAITIAEAEQSCVVFGMPAEAISRGGATHVATLVAMPQLIADSFANRRAAARPTVASDATPPARPPTRS